MPNYAPCRSGDDQDSHLYVSTDSGTSLCGKPVGADGPDTTAGKPCVVCARRLLAHLFQLGGATGVRSIEITVR